MLGTIALKIDIKWKFLYLGYGSTVYSQVGTVFADLGNRLDNGIIDHHIKDTNYESTFSALINNPYLVINHLLGPLNDTYYRGIEINRKEIIFTFITHKYPDWDGMASFFACDYMIRHGEPLPDLIAKTLAEATDIIDQGRTNVNGRVIRPFLIYNMMVDTQLTWDTCLLKGKKIIEGIIEAHKGLLSKDSFLDEYIPTDEFDIEAGILHKDFELFKEDLKKSVSIPLFLPTNENSAIETNAFVFQSEPLCKLHKFWVRETTDSGVLLVPFFNERKKLNRVVISVRPGDKFSLYCLGYELEKAESQKRDQIGEKRLGEPRYETEYCNNSDPWYDGRGHNFTIVDSPNVGTVLEYSEIINIVKELYSKPVPISFREPFLDAFISYRREGGSDIAWAVNTLLSEKGKKVFLDVSSLRTGRFDEQLLTYIQKSKCFLIILAAGTLDRCSDPGDWVLREIMEAVSLKKKIIPLMKPDFKLPTGICLPEEINELIRQQGIVLSHEYFYSAIEKTIQYMND